MSGRSAYVRKVKVDKNNKAGYDYLNKDDALKTKEYTPSIKSDPSISEFSRGDHGDTSHFAEHSDMMKSDEPSSRSVHSGHYEAEYNNNPGYARIRRPEVPIIETSGIEKSAFRSKMEKSSENFRHNLANVFKKKKGSKEESHEAQPETPIGEKDETNEEIMQRLSNSQPASPDAQDTQYERRPPIFKRAATFKGEIAPPVPAKTKIWRQKGQPAVLWDKFDVRDPDLWNFKGDVLVFFDRDAGENVTPQPVFRLTSFSLDNIGSPLIDALLREGITDELETKRIADSYQNDSNSVRNPTPPGSESSRSFDASQISYIITLPAAENIEGQELLRYKLSWRNVFAVYYDKGIVGYTLHQAMIDMHERYLTIMPRNQTFTHIPVGYTNRMGRFDLRNDPESACSMLIWSEHKKIRWQKGWHEAFAHCAGMYNQVTLLPSWKNVSPTTKLMLDKASVEISTKVACCEGLLANFDYESYWPESSSFQGVSSREAFVRLQGFFRDYYSYLFETWPPTAPVSKNVDGWLSRIIVKTLAADFFALYDYLVDRQVIWSNSAEMNSRRTILVRPGSLQFSPNTDECEFTSLIERFDNHHNFPSIPHPYPKLPDYSPPTRGKSTPLEARRCALSYTEATNIFILGDDYVSNDLVENYMQWEKTDRIGECDPRSARRARWVLIYFILQTLSTLVIDTPALAYSDEVEYFLSGKVEQQPLWIDDKFLKLPAQHSRSHCWTVPSTWKIPREGENYGVEPVPGKLESTATGMSTSSVSSHESVARTATFSEAETANDLETALTSRAASVADSEASFVTMQPPNHLSIRTRGLSLNKIKSPSSASAPSPSPKSTQSQLPDTVSLFPAPPRQPIEQYHSSKPSEKYYNPANYPPSLPPKAPLPETPSAYGVTPRHFQNPNRNITAYGPPRVRPSPYQSPSYPSSPFPGHDGEIMGLRIHKSASSTPLPSPTISSNPNTFAERSVTGYAPGIEKIEETSWPGSRNGNGNDSSNGSGNTSPVVAGFRNHQKQRNAQLSGEPLFKIRDFDELA